MSLSEQIDEMLRQKRESNSSWTKEKQQHLLSLMLKENFKPSK